MMENEKGGPGWLTDMLGLAQTALLDHVPTIYLSICAESCPFNNTGVISQCLTTWFYPEDGICRRTWEEGACGAGPQALQRSQAGPMRANRAAAQEPDKKALLGSCPGMPATPASRLLRDQECPRLCSGTVAKESRLFADQRPLLYRGWVTFL